MIVLMRSLAGLWIWSAGFALIYAAHGAGCSLGWHTVPAVGTSMHRVVLVGLFVASLVPAAWLAFAWRRYPSLPRLTHFHDWLAGVLAWTGLASLAFTGFPVAVASSCL